MRKLKKIVRPVDIAAPILPVLVTISLFPTIDMKGVLVAYCLVLAGLWGARAEHAL